MNASSAPIVRPSVSSTRRPRGSSPSCIASAGRPFARVGLSRIAARDAARGRRWWRNRTTAATRAPRGPVASSARRPRAAARRAHRRRRAPRRRRSARAARARPRRAGARERAGSLALDRRPRALERAVDRRRRSCRAARPTSAPGPAEHVAQDQHGALAAGQALDRGQERELHALAQRVARRRIDDRRGGSAQALVGVGLDDGRGPARAPLELVEAGVGGDPVEPRAGPTSGAGSGRGRARRGAASPARRPRRRGASRACGSSGPRGRGGTARRGRGRRARRRPRAAATRPARGVGSCS